MFNVLVANGDDSQRESYCNYLSKINKDLNVIGSENTAIALNTYNKINPNAFILDTNLDNNQCANIINTLSTTKKESKICNIILTTNISESIYPISNTEKIYKILFKPFEYTDLSRTVTDICENNQIPKLNEVELKLFLLDLKFNINSPCTKYLIEAIYQCYYYPNLLENLDDIIKLLAYKFKVSEKIIKSSFRNSLRPINNYRDNITNSSFINLFDKMRNITPKYFLEIITTYLHKQNNI